VSREREKYERRRRTRKKEQISRVLRRLKKVVAATEEHLHHPFTSFTDFLLSISKEAIPIPIGFNSRILHQQLTPQPQTFAYGTMYMNVFFSFLIQIRDKSKKFKVV